MSGAMTRQDPTITSVAGAGTTARPNCVAATSLGSVRPPASAISDSALSVVKCHNPLNRRQDALCWLRHG